MTSVTVDIRLAASREEVWSLVGDFGGLHRWHPFVPNCTLLEDGCTRVIDTQGPKVIEVMEAETTTSHTYTIQQSPIPMRDYHATISVEDDGEGCRVYYRSEFEPAGVAPAFLVRGFMWVFFKVGFASLSRRFS